MKKLINTITIILFCAALAIANNKINKLENQIKSINNNTVVQAAAVEEVEKEFKIVNTYVNKSNNNIIEFNDNSYVVINHNKNIYEFYAAECGDYEIQASNQIELINIIKTYMINKYNMLESEVNQNDIFKNDILTYTPVEAEKENTKSIAATQENKKVVNVVKKETNNNTIKNEVIEEPATEEAEESQEQPQNGYTEEDYNRYLEYKEGLIQEYGEEIYNLMNQEAGIKNEEESFLHYMEYGI